MPRTSRTKQESGRLVQTIKLQRLSDLKPCPTNAKTHSPAQIKLLARSIAVNGFVNPMLVDEQGSIIAGHGRYEAARAAGLEAVPTIVLGHLTEVQKRAYRIADNRLAEVGTGWSMELLKLEVDGILELDPDFDLGLTGFDARELNLSFDATASVQPQPDPEIPPTQPQAVTRLGDIWQIGEHRLICGDATVADSYKHLLGRERAAMVLADAPYNVPISGHVSGNGKVKHREFVAASGEMTDAEFQQFLTAFMLCCARFSKPGSLHYLFMDWRGLAPLLAAGAVAYDEYKNLCVWSKTQGGMGSMYRSQHELVAIFKKGKQAHTNNIELGKNGRNRTNVWVYAGMNSFTSDRDATLALHPTPKPVALVRDAILDASNRHDIILDPFGGSGTTTLAADAARRRSRLIELDPLYCDVIIRRCQEAMGMEATLLSSGKTFASVAAERETIDE
jgi:DNA modification methylase